MDISTENIPNTTYDWNNKRVAFKRAMSKVRRFKSNAAGEYYGGVTRFEDVDGCAFYSQHSECFPKLSIAIQKF